MSSSTLLSAFLQAVMKGQPVALKDRHYPGWHLAPVTGLLNDPNGFIQFDGRYHLFYQWNALGCQHLHKSWGHWSSEDLLHWQHEPIALLPEQKYDRTGCYSGSAVDNNGVLTLIYTGNVKFNDGSRTAWQCLAVQNRKGRFKKLGPVIALPAGYTGHVRDPKVWKHGEHWFMVLAAQDHQLKGKVLLLQSDDLHHWHNLGEIAGSGLGGLGDAGYMWECPDMFTLGESTYLICCPQGIAKEDKRFLNVHSSAWLSGTLDYHHINYKHGEFNELDAGFEFYAPQTTLSDDGRRLLVGWMGVPDGEEMLQPTIEHGWIHQMTCIRQLTSHNGRLYQQPVAELQALREEEQRFNGLADNAPTLDAQRLELLLEGKGGVTLNFADTLILEWSQDELRLARRSLKTNEWQYRWWCGEARKLQILCDHSSVEIFINEGEGVMSSRYFPMQPACLTLSGATEVHARYWLLRRCMVE
ncbi:sucrose-6-phosphate hydrolase [Erwinia tracheiphila]|uniref:Sucrose-6-phosphate hydrolase n=1 Tax=Erwinia tracheiphila TaxID=65700 RepID=A0A0M2KFD3_9GAMM|nr:sucrose-6-phosphate hydrolase [Erwinia tracheiphila]EOS94922.1 sucrose-6-phosphate hydrolase [Erwinia tracheiphila PSU-1]KKF36057.1 glycosyl hydrolase family 32 [Erwinia tracheiphila]UIA87377.1 sucrose-6-phosphate hydrolase [Erwinia tracheiphila]UIA95742.1 sucrose-6-phosphate hydrolase [Erwinia tracheiphila]